MGIAITFIMELKTAIETRHSVREFRDDPVEQEHIREIIRLAGLAPSINNYQPWRYYIITNSDILTQMAQKVAKEIALLPESTSRMAKVVKNQAAWYATFFVSAPMLIALAGKTYESEMEKGVVLSQDELNKMKNYPELQSAGASIQNLLLAATERGYGTCWMTGPLYAKQDLEEILDIQNPWSLISFVALGRAKDKSRAFREKRNLADEMIILD